MLLSALATNRAFSSGDSARLLGVEPGGEFGYSAAMSVSTALPVSVSSTVTVLRLALATKRCLPIWRAAFRSDAPRRPARRALGVLDVSMTATHDCAQKLT